MKNIKVSIICNTYNHEKYIRNALESFVAQKTNFDFEILVHDDASTDRTVEIVREYAEKYPALIKPIYQKENQHSQGIPVSTIYQYPRIKGKYVAFCEGDDYWTKEDKLQKQFDILEKDFSCIMVSHNTKRISVDGNEIDFMIEDMLDGYVLPRDIIHKTKKNPHFSSLMCRSELLKEERPEFFKLTTGDNALRCWALTKGKIYFINEVMSAYRVNTPNGWTNRMSKDHKKHIQYTQDVIKFLEKYDEYTNYIYRDCIKEEICHRRISIYKMEKDYKSAYRLSKTMELEKKEKIKLWLLAYIPGLKLLLKK